MRSSKPVFAALSASVAFVLLGLHACLDPGKCLRNSDCASVEMCSEGICVLAPVDDASTSDDGATTTDDDATTAVDTGTTSTTTDASDAADAITDDADASLADGASE
jgi:hypothetical protein